MAVSIRTRTAGGGQRYEHFELEVNGERALKAAVEALKAARYTVKRDGDIYTTTDASGVFVQRTEYRRSA